ncbi:peptidoglycan recognition protein family protein [Streptomyces sp. URMC 124]|uniref:peptidoglycan recognition protein family protein n=1 Tax=Streptomyces sp. URMC 124 TaxID=3423405 RepID=UPI003F1DE1A3
MRGILVSTTVTACAAALTLPFLAAPSSASSASSGTRDPGLPARSVPGSTQSLPLVPLHGRSRTAGPEPTGEQGLPQLEVKPFSLVGIVWDDAAAELRGHAQVRTRPVGGRDWAAWQEISTHDDDRPDSDSAEGRAGRLRGSTAPLWVGASDAIQVRVRPEEATGRTPAGALPRGLRLELVDPGADRTRSAAPPVPSENELAASAANVPLAPLGATEIPALGKPDSEGDVEYTGTGEQQLDDEESDDQADGDQGGGDGYDSEDYGRPSSSGVDGRYVGPRPRIVTRAGWGADESLRESGFAYTGAVRAAFVHHTASGNRYSCSQSASVIRGIYRYHVVSSGWRDVGYNFLIDKCGTVYEGRAGGVAKAVKGAHTLGFNSNSMGIAVLGTYGTTSPSSAAVDAVADLTAWKLGLFGANPAGTASLVSGGGNRFKKGTKVRLKAISGHRDGFATDCPGDRLYGRLGTVRSVAARLQGR